MTSGEKKPKISTRHTATLPESGSRTTATLAGFYFHSFCSTGPLRGQRSVMGGREMAGGPRWRRMDGRDVPMSCERQIVNDKERMQTTPFCSDDVSQPREKKNKTENDVPGLLEPGVAEPKLGNQS